MIYLYPLSNSSSTISYKHVSLLTGRGRGFVTSEVEGESAERRTLLCLAAGVDSEVLQDHHHHWVSGVTLAVRPQSQAVEKVPK